MGEKTEKVFPEFNFTDGELLLINKPYKWTSFDVVGKIRNSFKPLKLKVGHAGTLDPLATGLLIICTGKMTKKIDGFQAQQKEYTGTMILGASTPSYDLETEIDEIFDIGERGETIELKTRKISISQFEITRIELPEVDFKVVCSKGTYIRSLVHDFGKTLNNAAHLQSLRRTKSGDYDVENAFEVMELVNHIRQIKELGNLK